MAPGMSFAHHKSEVLAGSYPSELARMVLPNSTKVVIYENLPSGYLT